MTSGTHMSRVLKTSGAVAVVVLGALFLTVACGGGGGSEAPSASAADISSGHDQFKKTCAICHGPNGEGMPMLGKNLNANAFVQERSDAELVEFLKLGRPATHPDNTQGVDMPPKGGNPMLTDADLQSIVDYLRSLQ